MTTVWFIVLSLMMTVYAVLDGFDFGVGALMPFLCRTEGEKEQARHAIGPVWNGNEVWLLAGGGAMFVAFPRLYAASFSGFYLALMLVLWLFMLRGIGYEFRHILRNTMWTGVWDFAFALSSGLLALLFGVAVGNVLRGVPLNAAGEFQGSFAVMLNPFAIVAGLLSVAVLATHGCAYLVLKTDGALRDRARRCGIGTSIGAAVLAAAFAGGSLLVRPGFYQNFLQAPILIAVPVLAVVVLIATPVLLKSAGSDAGRLDFRPFVSTTLTIIGLLGSAAAGMFPRMLPALGNHPELDLTAVNTAASTHGLQVALVANVIGMTCVIAYMTYIYRTWSGKVASAAPVHRS